MSLSAAKGGGEELPQNIVATLLDRRCAIVSDSPTETGTLCVAPTSSAGQSDALDGFAPLLAQEVVDRVFSNAPEPVQIKEVFARVVVHCSILLRSTVPSASIAVVVNGACLRRP